MSRIDGEGLFISVLGVVFLLSIATALFRDSVGAGLAAIALAIVLVGSDIFKALTR